MQRRPSPMHMTLLVTLLPSSSHGPSHSRPHATTPHSGLLLHLVSPLPPTDALHRRLPPQPPHDSSDLSNASPPLCHSSTCRAIPPRRRSCLLAPPLHTPLCTDVRATSHHPFVLPSGAKEGATTTAYTVVYCSGDDEEIATIRDNIWAAVGASNGKQRRYMMHLKGVVSDESEQRLPSEVGLERVGTVSPVRG